MQELEKILKEIKGLHGKVGSECTIEDRHAKRAWEHCLKRVEDIVSNHMNDGWIPVEKRLPEKEYDTVLCVTDQNYYLICVYNKEIGFRISDFLVEGEIVAWRPLPEPYQPERRI